MAEIYTSADTQALSVLSPDANDAIARLLADLGLPADTGSSVAPSDDASLLLSGGDPAPMPGHTAPLDVDQPEPGTLTGLVTPEPAAPPADASDPLGSEPLSGSETPQGHLLASGGDTLVSGLGMDTLWGASASPAHAPVSTAGEVHVAADAGDSVLSSGGFDTLHGGFASLQSTGDHATIYAFGDTIAATGGHALIDATASPAPIRVDAYGGDATILGGAGDDTIGLHDVSSGRASVFGGEGNDIITGSPGGWGTYAGGAGDDHFLTFGLNDSVMGGDGSDLFSIAAFGTGHDTISGGGGEDAVLFAERAFADAHVSHDGSSTLVTFGDGYSASIDGVEQLRFRDTILNA